jgi:hypothetical protein
MSCGFSCRPYGTAHKFLRKPSTSVLGYFRPSLRDWFVSGFEGGCWLKRSYRDWFAVNLKTPTRFCLGR